MPGRKKRRHRGPNNPEYTLASVARETATSLAGDSPVLAIFKNAAMKLTARHDRHERLAKLSHDITVESKRIINLLHTPMTFRMDEPDNIITEAKERILELINEPIKNIGLELENIPAHLHSRAVTAGFQNYVEARTLLSLMTEKRIITYPEVQKEFEYSITGDDQQRTVVTMLPHDDYMLGLADLTGELMRKVTNSISSGDIEECNQACDVIRHLYTGFLGITTDNRFLQHKVQIPRANVKKVELAMYALHIRGREAPPKMLLPAAPEWEAPRGPGDAAPEWEAPRGPGDAAPEWEAPRGPGDAAPEWEAPRGPGDAAPEWEAPRGPGDADDEGYYQDCT